MELVAIDREPAESIRAACASNEILAQTVQATLDLYGRRGFVPPWIGFLGREDGAFVGGCGFAAPAAHGEAEIAYFTFPGGEGRGIASRMAAALLRLARPHAGGIAFIAHTLPEESPSTSILRKLGFTLEGTIAHPEDGPVWKWREAAR